MLWLRLFDLPDLNSDLGKSFCLEGELSLELFVLVTQSLEVVLLMLISLFIARVLIKSWLFVLTGAVSILRTRV